MISQEIFTNLPSEIVINIFSRLPVRTIVSCKCVCKSWLDLLQTPEFANSHLSKSVHFLVFGSIQSTYKIFEFEEGLDLEHHHHHYNPITEFVFPHGPLKMKGSVNGLLLLLLLRAQTTDPIVLYVCNPITRDYIQLDTDAPKEFVYSFHRNQVIAYGFGASKISGQLKVVRILHYLEHPKTSGISKSQCQVYTLGTGSWRSIQPSPPLDYSSDGTGALLFLNGNLHWRVNDPQGSLWISCFDLETECFSTFSPPPVRHHRRAKSLFALGGCLCLCDNSSYHEIVIWSMKEYGDEKSWIKEFVIGKNPDFVSELFEPDYPSLGDRSYVVLPIKVFRDGDILMALEDFFLLYYSNKTKTIRKIHMFRPPSIESCIEAILHTPSFLSLKTFPMENVSSF